MAVWQVIKNIWDRLLSVLYPEHCGFCGREVEYGKWICRECEKLVKLKVCDGEVPQKFGDVMFDRLFYSGSYEGITRDGILRFKKEMGYNAAKYLSLALVKNIMASDMKDRIDCIAYVPVSPRKKIKNGYDHAEVMAKYVSEMLSVPIEKDTIRRRNSRRSQHSQRSYDKRRRLAESVYTLPKKSKNLEGKIILLCDDIVTSGATFSKCADILKAQGADMVCAAALVMAGE